MPRQDPSTSKVALFSCSLVLALSGATSASGAGEKERDREERGQVTIGVQPDDSIVIPTGQTLTPAGRHIEVNDRPLGMVVSPNGKLLAVVTGSNFNPRALYIVDLQTYTVKQMISIGDAFVGVDFSPGGNTIYVGGSRNNDIKIFTLAPTGQ